MTLSHYTAHPSSAFLHQAPMANPQALTPEGSIFSSLSILPGWGMTLSFPHRDKDQSSSIISGFAGLLTILLVIALLCILWNWNKRKKRESPVCPKFRQAMANSLGWHFKPSVSSPGINYCTKESSVLLWHASSCLPQDLKLWLQKAECWLEFCFESLCTLI